jgi:hypothetical protein
MILSGVEAVFLSAFIMARIMIHGIMTVGTMTPGITGHIIRTIIGIMTPITVGGIHITGTITPIMDIIRIGVDIQEVIIRAIIMEPGIIMTMIKRKSFTEDFLQEKGILFQLLMQKIKTCQVIAVCESILTIQNPPHQICQVVEAGTVLNPSRTEDQPPPLKEKDKTLKVQQFLQTEIQMQTGHDL